MDFGFSLELSDVDLLDAHLDLLDTDVPSKYFVCLHNFFKTSSRHVFKSSSRCFPEMSSRRPQDMSSRRLEDILSVTIFRVSRRLQVVLEDVKLLR